MNNRNLLIGGALAAGVLVIVLAIFAWGDNQVREIRELARTGSDESAMLAVVEKSTSPYTLSADDIITLKKDGVPDSVVLKMLNHKP